MALYLVQHGRSLSKEADPERGLSEEVIRETELVAKAAGNYGISFSRPVFQFQNSGIVCLDRAAEAQLWLIKWALMPRIE